MYILKISKLLWLKYNQKHQRLSIEVALVTAYARRPLVKPHYLRDLQVLVGTWQNHNRVSFISLTYHIILLFLHNFIFSESFAMCGATLVTINFASSNLSKYLRCIKTNWYWFTWLTYQCCQYEKIIEGRSVFKELSI